MGMPRWRRADPSSAGKFFLTEGQVNKLRSFQERRSAMKEIKPLAEASFSQGSQESSGSRRGNSRVKNEPGTERHGGDIGQGVLAQRTS